MRKGDTKKRIKQALKTRLQPSHEEVFQRGDTVIVLNKIDEWGGPPTEVTKQSMTLPI